MDQKKESVNGIIFSEDKQKVLLIKRRDIPVWVLPGGGIELNETPELSAVREVEEETGYRVKLVRKIAEYTPISSLALFTHFYECTIEGGEPTCGEETSAIHFFPLNALPYHLPPPYPDWIADAAAFSKGLLKKPIMSVTYLSLFKHALSHPLLVLRFLWIRLTKA